jgi:diguanylate cyclase (GGDEF)-like protein
MPSIRSLPRLPLIVAAVCAAVMLVLQGINYGLVASHLARQARLDTRTQLLNAAPSLDNLLEQRALRMLDAARALAVQPHFATAAVHGDAAVLEPALGELGSKLGSETLAVTTANGLPLAGASTATATLLKAMQATAPLPRDPDGEPVRRMVLADWQLFQVVALPLPTGSSTHWLVCALPLTEATLAQWRKSAGGETALLVRQPNSPWHLMAGTLKRPDDGLPDSVWAEINPGKPNARRPSGLHSTSVWLQPRIGEIDYDARFTLLTDGDPTNANQSQAGVMVLAPTTSDSTNRDALLGLLLPLALVGCGLVAVAGFVVTRPTGVALRRLTSWVNSLQGGQYKSPPKNLGLGEVSELARSLDAMQKAVRERESEIMHLAYRDTLTNLPNREKFRHDLRKIVAKAIEADAPCSILVMDLDRFKHVNDVLGHGFGDRLLRMVAQRLRDEVLDNSMPLARLGGDEFAVLLKRADAPGAKRVAKHILHALERPLQLDDHTIDLAAGIGIASCPAHSTDADELLSRAEIAMYAAKQQQSGIVIFQPTLDAGSQASLSLLSELRRAVDESQLRLFLQPKVSLASGQVIGAEALVRWQHPQRGMVPPTQFIPFAEQTGFIRKLSMWMVERTARIWRELHNSGLTLKISVNLSTRDLLDQDLPAKLERIIKQHGVHPGALVLEITESATMDDPDRALQTLASLHRLGLRLSIDDFGTGYSSLAYLKRLPVDELKIDKSFVMKMESDLDDAKIVRSTIDLAHNLGLSVVAEGIENEQTWKLLGGLKCDEAQGYFIARPMHADQFFDWVRGWQTPQTENVRLSTDFAKMI